MKEKIKNLPVIGRRLVGLYSRYLRLQNQKFLDKNRELKNKFSGRRCFVIATGPSIKTQDLKQLAGELSISVSNFFVHPDFKIIKPEFHLFAPSHPPITDEQYGAMLADAERHFPEGQNVLVSITDKHIVESFGVFRKQNLYYYSLGNKELKPSAEIDFTRDIPAIQTSPHIAIYLALYAGAKEINLLGTDHDWLLHIGETRHFYDEKKSVLSREGYNEWFGGMEHQFESHLNLWRLYRRIREYAEKHSVSVRNLSPKSLLDVFPMGDFDEVVKDTKQT